MLNGTQSRFFATVIPFFAFACSAGADGTNQTTNGTPHSGGATAQGAGGRTPASGQGGANVVGMGGTSNANGGTTAAGTTSSTGGVTNTTTGGAPTGSGGSTTPAGGVSQGGTTTAGGTNPGGATASGGMTAVAGTTGAGGTASKGGATGAGGATAAGGATGSGGATAAGGATSGTNEFWISPTGNDSNSGTKDSPLFSLCDDTGKKGACYKVCGTSGTCLTGGATIWVMDGTYKYGAVTQKIGSTKLGTASGVFNVFAVAGAKPVFDFTGMPVSSDSRGLQLQGDYWHIRGITVTKAGDTGIFVMGNNNIIDQCVVHHNQDAGLVIGVNSSRAGSGVNNLILNCDSYQNFDSATDGENADGFGMKENAGTGNVFRGCRAWDNGDDGWDFYGWSSPITVDNCWAISQTSTVYGGQSDGNGFKLGGNSVSATHKLSNLISVGNGTHGSSGRGFTNNSNPATLTCTGTCGSWSNKAADTGVGGITLKSGPTAAKMIAAVRLANGDLPDINSL